MNASVEGKVPELCHRKKININKRENNNNVRKEIVYVDHKRCHSNIYYNCKYHHYCKYHEYTKDINLTK